VLQASLQSTLNQVKGQIAVFVAEAAAAAAAKSDGALKNAKHTAGFPAPPPDSRANIAIRAAMSYLGTWYCWGGASRRCVDCSLSLIHIFVSFGDGFARPVLVNVAHFEVLEVASEWSIVRSHGRSLAARASPRRVPLPRRADAS